MLEPFQLEAVLLAAAAGAVVAVIVVRSPQEKSWRFGNEHPFIGKKIKSN